MLKPIVDNSYASKFAFSFDGIKKQKERYDDPLLSWPLRGAAFTNEVGEALRPLIGNYATLSWVPALLYIGADVYDKYKNNQTEYSPSSKRCLKQAIFQGMASIFLPLVAVKGGQSLFSLAGIKSERNLTINAQENIINTAKEFVANGQMRAHKYDDEKCVKDFLDIVHNKLDYNKQRKATDNKVIKVYYNIVDKLRKPQKINSSEKIANFSESVIKELIKMRKDLLNPSEEFMQTKHYANFNLALGKGQSRNVAVKTVLDKHLSNIMLKGKLVKTLGGFVALGIAIKPIDHFVEHFLIGKVLGPTIDNAKAPTFRRAAKQNK